MKKIKVVKEEDFLSRLRKAKENMGKARTYENAAALQAAEKAHKFSMRQSLTLVENLK